MGGVKLIRCRGSFGIGKHLGHRTWHRFSAISQWPQKASGSKESAGLWWGQTWPESNISIATGRRSNLFVLDVDGLPERMPTHSPFDLRCGRCFRKMVLLNLLLGVNAESPMAASDVLIGTLIGRYEVEEMPKRYSTGSAYQSYLKCHIEPRWETTLIRNVKPMVVEDWLNALKLAPKTKSHIKQLLQWGDFDFENQTVLVQRGVVHGYVGDVKTEYSKDHRPLDPLSVDLLGQHRERCYPTAEGWLFANPSTGRPFHQEQIVKTHIKKATTAAGIEGDVGWHTFRHSYRTWLDQAGASMTVQKALMRHASITTTMDIYGRSVSDGNRQANSNVVEMVLREQQPRSKRQKAG